MAKIWAAIAAVVIMALSVALTKLFWPTIESQKVVETKWYEDTSHVSALSAENFQLQAKLVQTQFVVQKTKEAEARQTQMAAFYKALSDSIFMAEAGKPTTIPRPTFDSLVVHEENLYSTADSGHGRLVYQATYIDTLSGYYDFVLGRFSVHAGFSQRIIPYKYHPLAANDPIKIYTKNWTAWGVGGASGIVVGYGFGAKSSTAVLIGVGGLAVSALFNWLQ
jgi:hypothetical protein